MKTAAVRDMYAEDIPAWDRVVPSPESLTEAGAAERFCRLHGHDVRYDHRRGGWLVWRRHRFVRDCDGAVMRLALDFVRDWQREAVEIPDRERREAVFKQAIRLERRDALTSMLTFASHLKPIADSGDQWDRDPWLLGCPNGVLDLSTGSLRPGRRDDSITMNVGVDFDEAASAPRFERFVREISNDDLELVEYQQRRFGYALTGRVDEQVLWMDYGTGANGKSTLLHALLTVWGDYGDVAPFSTFERSSMRSTIPNDLAALDRKRLVFASETREGAQLDEGRLKGLTGGDPMRARFLNAEWFTFTPMLKLVLCINHRPVTTDDSFGFWRRVRLVPFDRTFDPDHMLAGELAREQAGILAWAVRGCLDWQVHGLRHPVRVQAATKEYAVDSDPLARFLAEACEEHSEAEIGAAEFYTHYNMWADKQGLNQRERLTSTKFGTRMRARFKRQDGARRVYLGVARKEMA